MKKRWHIYLLITLLLCVITFGLYSYRSQSIATENRTLLKQHLTNALPYDKNNGLDFLNLAESYGKYKITIFLKEPISGNEFPESCTNCYNAILSVLEKNKISDLNIDLETNGKPAYNWDTSNMTSGYLSDLASQPNTIKVLTITGKDFTITSTY